MKFLQYLNYFFYIAFNWNIRLAFFTIYHEIKGERKYGIQTSKLNDLKKVSLTGSNAGHAENYQGANYYLLENVFAWLLNIPGQKNITDFGCGKGRVLVVAAFYGFTKITGVDFAKELCEEAQKNITPLQRHFPEKTFRVVHNDAATHQIADDMNVFFFFNPFDEVVMLAVVKNILASLKENPREVYVIYLNPLHEEIFKSAGFEQVYYFEKLTYVRASILKKSPDDYGAFETL
jgi:SAM-dependent methyltransferase